MPSAITDTIYRVPTGVVGQVVHLPLHTKITLKIGL